MLIIPILILTDNTTTRQDKNNHNLTNMTYYNITNASSTTSHPKGRGVVSYNVLLHADTTPLPPSKTRDQIGPPNIPDHVMKVTTGKAGLDNRKYGYRNKGSENLKHIEVVGNSTTSRRDGEKSKILPKFNGTSSLSKEKLVSKSLKNLSSFKPHRDVEHHPHNNTVHNTDILIGNEDAQENAKIIKEATRLLVLRNDTLIPGKASESHSEKAVRHLMTIGKVTLKIADCLNNQSQSCIQENDKARNEILEKFFKLHSDDTKVKLSHRLVQIGNAAMHKGNELRETSKQVQLPARKVSKSNQGKKHRKIDLERHDEGPGRSSYDLRKTVKGLFEKYDSDSSFVALKSIKPKESVAEKTKIDGKPQPKHLQAVSFSYHNKKGLSRNEINMKKTRTDFTKLDENYATHLQMALKNSAPKYQKIPLCSHGHRHKNVIPKYGLHAGQIVLHGIVTSMDRCIKYCCESHTCNLALLVKRECFTITCKSEFHCRFVPNRGHKRTEAVFVYRGKISFGDRLRKTVFTQHYYSSKAGEPTHPVTVTKFDIPKREEEHIVALSPEKQRLGHGNHKNGTLSLTGKYMKDKKHFKSPKSSNCTRILKSEHRKSTNDSHISYANVLKKKSVLGHKVINSSTLGSATEPRVVKATNRSQLHHTMQSRRAYGPTNSSASLDPSTKSQTKKSRTKLLSTKSAYSGTVNAKESLEPAKHRATAAVTRKIDTTSVSMNTPTKRFFSATKSHLNTSTTSKLRPGTPLQERNVSGGSFSSTTSVATTAVNTTTNQLSQNSSTTSNISSERMFFPTQVHTKSSTPNKQDRKSTTSENLPSLERNVPPSKIRTKTSTSEHSSPMENPSKYLSERKSSKSRKLALRAPLSTTTPTEAFRQSTKAHTRISTTTETSTKISSTSRHPSRAVNLTTTKLPEEPSRNRNAVSKSEVNEKLILSKFYSRSRDDSANYDLVSQVKNFSHRNVTGSKKAQKSYRSKNTLPAKNAVKSQGNVRKEGHHFVKTHDIHSSHNLSNRTIDLANAVEIKKLRKKNSALTLNHSKHMRSRNVSETGLIRRRINWATSGASKHEKFQVIIAKFMKPNKPTELSTLESLQTTVRNSHQNSDHNNMTNGDLSFNKEIDDMTGRKEIKKIISRAGQIDRKQHEKQLNHTTMTHRESYKVPGNKSVNTKPMTQEQSHVAAQAEMPTEPITVRMPTTPRRMTQNQSKITTPLRLPTKPISLKPSNDTQNLEQDMSQEKTRNATSSIDNSTNATVGMKSSLDNKREHRKPEKNATKSLSRHEKSKLTFTRTSNRTHAHSKNKHGREKTVNHAPVSTSIDKHSRKKGMVHERTKLVHADRQDENAVTRNELPTARSRSTSKVQSTSSRTTNGMTPRRIPTEPAPNTSNELPTSRLYSTHSAQSTSPRTTYTTVHFKTPTKLLPNTRNELPTSRLYSTHIAQRTSPRTTFENIHHKMLTKSRAYTPTTYHIKAPFRSTVHPTNPVHNNSGLGGLGDEQVTDNTFGNIGDEVNFTPIQPITPAEIEKQTLSTKKNIHNATSDGKMKIPVEKHVEPTQKQAVRPVTIASKPAIEPPKTEAPNVPFEATRKPTQAPATRSAVKVAAILTPQPPKKLALELSERVTQKLARTRSEDAKQPDALNSNTVANRSMMHETRATTAYRTTSISKQDDVDLPEPTQHSIKATNPKPTQKERSVTAASAQQVQHKHLSIFRNLTEPRHEKFSGKEKEIVADRVEKLGESRFTTTNSSRDISTKHKPKRISYQPVDSLLKSKDKTSKGNPIKNALQTSHPNRIVVAYPTPSNTRHSNNSVVSYQRGHLRRTESQDSRESAESLTSRVMEHEKEQNISKENSTVPTLPDQHVTSYHSKANSIVGTSRKPMNDASSVARNKAVTAFDVIETKASANHKHRNVTTLSRSMNMTILSNSAREISANNSSKLVAANRTQTSVVPVPTEMQSYQPLSRKQAFLDVVKSKFGKEPTQEQLLKVGLINMTKIDNRLHKEATKVVNYVANTTGNKREHLNHSHSKYGIDSSTLQVNHAKYLNGSSSRVARNETKISKHFTFAQTITNFSALKDSPTTALNISESEKASTTNASTNTNNKNHTATQKITFNNKQASLKRKINITTKSLNQTAQRKYQQSPYWTDYYFPWRNYKHPTLPVYNTNKTTVKGNNNNNNNTPNPFAHKRLFWRNMPGQSPFWIQYEKLVTNATVRRHGKVAQNVTKPRTGYRLESMNKTINNATLETVNNKVNDSSLHQLFEQALKYENMILQNIQDRKNKTIGIDTNDLQIKGNKTRFMENRQNKVLNGGKEKLFDLNVTIIQKSYDNSVNQTDITGSRKANSLKKVTGSLEKDREVQGYFVNDDKQRMIHLITGQNHSHLRTANGSKRVFSYMTKASMESPAHHNITEIAKPIALPTPIAPISSESTAYNNTDLFHGVVNRKTKPDVTIRVYYKPGGYMHHKHRKTKKHSEAAGVKKTPDTIKVYYNPGNYMHKKHKGRKIHKNETRGDRFSSLLPNATKSKDLTEYYGIAKLYLPREESNEIRQSNDTLAYSSSVSNIPHANPSNITNSTSSFREPVMAPIVNANSVMPSAAVSPQVVSPKQDPTIEKPIQVAVLAGVTNMDLARKQPETSGEQFDRPLDRPLTSDNTVQQPVVQITELTPDRTSPDQIIKINTVKVTPIQKPKTILTSGGSKKSYSRSDSDEQISVTPKHSFHRKPENATNCNLIGIYTDKVLRDGAKAGNFFPLPFVRDPVHCHRKCCKNRRCNFALFYRDFCYTIECFTVQGCELVHSNVLTKHPHLLTKIREPEVMSLSRVYKAPPEISLSFVPTMYIRPKSAHEVGGEKRHSKSERKELMNLFHSLLAKLENHHPVTKHGYQKKKPLFEDARKDSDITQRKPSQHKNNTQVSRNEKISSSSNQSASVDTQSQLFKEPYFGMPLSKAKMTFPSDNTSDYLTDFIHVSQNNQTNNATVSSANETQAPQPTQSTTTKALSHTIIASAHPTLHAALANLSDSQIERIVVNLSQLLSKIHLQLKDVLPEIRHVMRHSRVKFAKEDLARTIFDAIKQIRTKELTRKISKITGDTGFGFRPRKFDERHYNEKNRNKPIKEKDIPWPEPMKTDPRPTNHAVPVKKPINSDKNHFKSSPNATKTEQKSSEMTQNVRKSKQTLDGRLTCIITSVRAGATLYGGPRAGIFTSHGGGLHLSECVRRCCTADNCHVALLIAGHCYTVKCFTAKLCKVVPMKRGGRYVMTVAYVRRSITYSGDKHGEMIPSLSGNVLPYSAVVCQESAVYEGFTLKGGYDAGHFSYRGEVSTITDCVEYCCNTPLCDLVFMVTNQCYLVYCYGKDGCKHVKAYHGVLYRTRIVYLRSRDKIIPPWVPNGNELRANIGHDRNTTAKFQELTRNQEVKHHLQNPAYANNHTGALKPEDLNQKQHSALKASLNPIPQSCLDSKMHLQTTVSQGHRSGKFLFRGKKHSDRDCIRECCINSKCNVALILRGYCFSVVCKSIEACKPVKAKKSIHAPRMAMVRGDFMATTGE